MSSSSCLPTPLVDIHCHLLPGIDDGAADWGESVAMARLATGEGIHVAVATPHQLGRHARNQGNAIRQRTAELQEVLARQGVTLRVVPGADVRIEPGLAAKVQTGEVLTLADQGRYVLLELPHEVYLPMERLLVELRAAGLVGILSHPERNAGILARPSVVGGLVDNGCLMQVTAASLLGGFGPQVQGCAERLVTGGLVHFVATDAHGCRVRRPLLRRAFQRVAELAGPEIASRLCSIHPAAVVSNRTVPLGRVESAGHRPARWFRKAS